jgi:NAD+ diphosphatase
MADMPYSGLTLDRATSRRGDPAWVAALRARADTRVISMWRDRCLVRDGCPVTARADAAGNVLAAAENTVLLGLDGDAAVFAADLSSLDQAEATTLLAADAVADVRRLVGTLTAAEAGTLAYARGILHWNRHQRFCGACGGRTGTRDGGHLRVCADCGRLLFPRIEPAVIVLVELPGEPRRCLLARHRGPKPGSFSTLAGFVEIGENLEDAVRREVAEEAGVTLAAMSYQGSQAWPFPSGLMVGFRAQAASAAIEVDGVELVEARWFTATELRERISAAGPGSVLRADSIETFLIEGWLSDVG